MPRRTSSDRVCYPRAVMACHTRRCRLCVLSKGSDVMPRPTSFDRLCCPKTMMAFHAQHRPTVRAVQGPCCHATPDVVRPYVQSKGGDIMPRPTLPTVCVVQGR